MTAITLPGTTTYTLASITASLGTSLVFPGSIYGVAAIAEDANKSVTGFNNVWVPDYTAPYVSQQNTMSTGAVMLCQNPDGSKSNYVFDAERSMPNNPVLRKV
jgi:hypothetical protein